MRESDHFDYLSKVVFPYIEQKYGDKRDLRLWCAACSSGEEAYTLAVLANEYFGKLPVKWDTKILATDISTQVLDKAVKGVYSAESLSPLPEKWRKTYFHKYDSDNYIVTDELRSQIIFRKLNLVEGSFPFKKQLQIIFIRNCMIYMDNDTRDALVRKFFDVTEAGGYLFIGHSESLNHTDTKFKYIMPAVYRKN
jgi:chemotaxis protein methyltransferase CheR